MNDTLLQMLVDMRKNPDTLPRDGFIANARIRILNVSTDKEPVYNLGQRSRWSPVRYEFITVGLTMIFGGSIVYASQSSLPGSTLYPVKVASEIVALDLAPTSAIKTAVAGAVIDRRADEVTELKTYAPSQAVQQAVTQYRETISDFRSMHGLNTSKIEEHIRKHEDIFGTEGDRRKEEKEGNPTPEIAPVSSPTTVPTPTGAQSENKESSTTTSSGVLGTHSWGDKHGDDHEN